MWEVRPELISNCKLFVITRVKDLSESTKSSLALLEAAVAGNVEDLSPHFTILIPLLTWALRSHLIAPQVCSLFVKLRSAVFEQQDDVYGKI